MHTIKHIHFLCYYAKKTCSDDKQQFVCTYITRYKVFGIVSLLSAGLNAMIVMIMIVVH